MSISTFLGRLARIYPLIGTRTRRKHRDKYTFRNFIAKRVNHHVPIHKSQRFISRPELIAMLLLPNQQPMRHNTAPSAPSACPAHTRLQPIPQPLQSSMANPALKYNRDVQKQWRVDLPGFIVKVEIDWPSVSSHAKVIG